jgi:hypothetical protein
VCRGAWRSVAKTLEKTVARLRSRRCSAAQAPALSLTEGHPTGGRQEGRPGSVGVGLAGGRGRRGRGGGEEGRPSLERVERGRERERERRAARTHHTRPPFTPHQVRGTTRFHPPPSLSPVAAPHQGLTRHLPLPPQAVCGGLRPGLRARGAREKQREGGGAPARVLFRLLPHLPAPHTARFPPPPACHRGQARAAKGSCGMAAAGVAGV